MSREGREDELMDGSGGHFDKAGAWEDDELRAYARNRLDDEAEIKALRVEIERFHKMQRAAAEQYMTTEDYVSGVVRECLNGELVSVTEVEEARAERDRLWKAAVHVQDMAYRDMVGSHAGPYVRAAINALTVVLAVDPVSPDPATRYRDDHARRHPDMHVVGCLGNPVGCHACRALTPPEVAATPEETVSGSQAALRAIIRAERTRQTARATIPPERDNLKGENDLLRESLKRKAREDYEQRRDLIPLNELARALETFSEPEEPSS